MKAFGTFRAAALVLLVLLPGAPAEGGWPDVPGCGIWGQYVPNPNQQAPAGLVTFH